jgi:hypothetical protein
MIPLIHFSADVNVLALAKSLEMSHDFGQTYGRTLCSTPQERIVWMLWWNKSTPLDVYLSLKKTEKIIESLH